MRRWIGAIALIGVMAFSTSGCINSSGLWPASLGGVSKSVNMDSYLSPGFAGAHPTTCRFADTPRFNERCAVNYGVESDQSGGWPADNRNWYVDYADDYTVNHPKAWGCAGTNFRCNPFTAGPDQACPAGADVDPYGCTIAIGSEPGSVVSGYVFWGCEWQTSGNIWFCDGRERAISVPYSGPLDWRTTMRASLDWGTYVLNQLSCAAGVTAAEIITSAELEGCGDGPYPGFGNNGKLDVPLLEDPEIPGPIAMGPQVRITARVIGAK